MKNKVKVEKEYPEFVSEVASLSTEDLNNRIATYAKESESVSQSMEQNETIISAKEELKLLLEPHRDAKKALKLKTQYIISLLQDRGAE